MFKANDPSSSFSSGLKRCVVKPLISSISPVVGKYTPENSSLDEKRVLGESDLGFCKTRRDDKTSTHSKKLMAEGDEDMPNSSKKTKREGVKTNPGKSCPVNLLNSNMICSQGTPSSLNKVLSNMLGSLRSCLL